MKAELDQLGVLTISPETPTEAYAIIKWSEEAIILVNDTDRMETCYIRGSKILVSLDPSLPKKD